MNEDYSKAAQKLNTYLKFSLDRKVELSKRKIKQAVNTHDNLLISSSFGKDSVTLIHLVMETTKDFDIVFNKTGVQFQETIEFIDNLKEKWDLDVKVIEPDHTFWEIVDEYGYPKESRNSKTGDTREPKCCKYLKEKPMKEFIRENDYDLDFVGLTGGEGRQRRWAYIRQGCAIYEHKTWGIDKCIPLIWWEQNDVWDYVNRENLPTNPVYEKYGLNRTGCIPCTGHKEWRKK